MINKEKICLIAGVGPGTGKECTKKFSNNGYKVAMLARNLEFLSKLEKEIPNTKAFKCDVGNTVSIINTCKKIKEQIGHPSVFIHNAVAGILDGGGASNFLGDNPENLEKNLFFVTIWRKGR